MSTVETFIDPYDTLTVIFYAFGTTILAESFDFFLFFKKKFVSRNMVFNLQ